MNKTVISRSRIIAYWITTAIIVLETGVGAVWDIMHIEFVTNVMQRIGFPLYFLTIIGIWKILAVPVLLAPGVPILKEWAYAGILFIYTGAVFSHIASDDAANALSPLILAAIAAASWALRPSSRRFHLS